MYISSPYIIQYTFAYDLQLSQDVFPVVYCMSFSKVLSEKSMYKNVCDISLVLICECFWFCEEKTNTVD